MSPAGVVNIHTGMCRDDSDGQRHTEADALDQQVAKTPCCAGAGWGRAPPRLGQREYAAETADPGHGKQCHAAPLRLQK